jgi:hypothetical protein
MRLVLAVRAFLRVMTDRTFAARIEDIFQGRQLAAVSAPAPRPEVPEPRKAMAKRALRSEAITLLAALQREARFVDIVREPLSGYTDAQIGAAARDVLRDCGNVLERLFALRPLVQQDEGSEMELPAGYDAGRFRLTGNVHGEPPFRGTLAHHGWEATRCDLPQWSGSEGSARVVAPIEVELR